MGNEVSMDNLIREYSVGEFRGNYPDVPIAEGVNLEELKETDATPFFVTLPVVPEVGAISKNGLLYDDALVSSIEKQINDKKPGGIFGHLKDEERSTAFPLPSGMWVGARREGNTLWAKAYIPPGEARSYIRQLKAVGGQIATSIYGDSGGWEKVKDGVKRPKNFKLESLDFAPPERAALGVGSTPIVTSELEQPNPGKDDDMERSQFLAELRADDVPQTVREQILSGLKATVTELETKNAALELAVNEFRQKQFEAAIDAKVSELTNWQVKGDEATKRLAKFRQTLRTHLLTAIGNERDTGKVAELINGAWEDLKPLAETVRDALAGPAAIVNGKTRSGSSEQWRDDLANKAGELRKERGI